MDYATLAKLARAVTADVVIYDERQDDRLRPAAMEAADGRLAQVTTTPACPRGAILVATRALPDTAMMERPGRRAGRVRLADGYAVFGGLNP